MTKLRRCWTILLLAFFPYTLPPTATAQDPTEPPADTPAPEAELTPVGEAIEPPDMGLTGAEASDTAASSATSLAGTEPVVPAVILEAREVLAKSADEITVDEVKEVSERVEAEIPVIMASVQEARKLVNQIRQSGRTHPSLNELMLKLDALNKEIVAAIESIPELIEAKEIADVQHKFVLESMRLRVQLNQKLMEVKRSGSINIESADPAVEAITSESE